MLIYHTSNLIIEKPDTLHSRDNLDFGKGFYATVLEEQARNYARKFMLMDREAVMNIYELSSLDDFNVKSFAAYDGDWLDFVAACRKGNDVYNEFDVIEGGIANDRIFNTLDLYFSGELSKEEALKKLIYEKPNQQFCFVSQEALDRCVRYVGYEIISK